VRNLVAFAPALALTFACGTESKPTHADAALDGPAAADAGPDAPPGVFALTSPALVEGGMIDAAITCDGANTSPELSWTSAPADTQSFAVVLTDKTNDLVHWVIYDIPASATGLPSAVMKVYSPANVPGAHQTTSYNTNVTGYLGPCPPPAQGAHMYEFAAYALDVATLPGASSTTTRQQAVPIIMMHALASATLTGSYER
jgi:Raf kinase inhibitor-like YbhB/YbcL family protein